MKGKVEIRYDKYSHIEYNMFKPSKLLKFFMVLAKLIAFPFVVPFILIAKISPKSGFKSISELLSIIPFVIGEIVRYDFYKFTLRSCGKNVFISFGAVFYYPEICIGNNVVIGMYNTIHHCDFGSHVMTAEGCRFLSGSKYHNFGRTDIPMTEQGGELKRIQIEDDVWIGSNSVIMEKVSKGSIVGAGSVVNKPVEPFSIVAGNPAKQIKKRE